MATDGSEENTTVEKLKLTQKLGERAGAETSEGQHVSGRVFAILANVYDTLESAVANYEREGRHVIEEEHREQIAQGLEAAERTLGQAIEAFNRALEDTRQASRVFREVLNQEA